MNTLRTWIAHKVLGSFSKVRSQLKSYSIFRFDTASVAAYQGESYAGVIEPRLLRIQQ